MVKVDKFNDYKPARISKELYEVEKCRWRLSVPATRLLFALSQIVSEDKDSDLFPELGFSLSAMFKYLGLTNNKDKYNRLQEALREVRESGLDIIQNTKKGRKWIGTSWITDYEFSTYEPLVKITIAPKAKPFLRSLIQYARIQPKIYLKLSSEYQNWFYPYFKQFENLGKWTVSIEELKTALKLEKEDSYNSSSNVNATKYFLIRVIGIELSPEAKAENTLAKRQKRQARPIEWNYTKNAKGEYTGTLFHISDKTDLNVTAGCLKTGRSYTHIIFFISKKSIKKASNANADSNASADVDFQKPKRHKAKTKSDIKDIFASEFDERLYIPNPAYEKELPKRIAYYSDEQINEMAKASNRSADHIVQKMSLKKDSEGKWFKEY